MGLPPDLRTPRIYGHRGSRLRRRDNTIESFRLALDEGADGIETDVRRLVDGSLVLFNAELVGDRPTNTLDMEDLVRAQAAEIARPADLGVIARGSELILEVKERGCEERLVEVVQAFPSVVICSFDHRVVVDLARLRVETAASFRLGVTIAGRLIAGAGYVRDLGADWFFPASSFVDAETVAEFTEAGIPVVPWVLNLRSQWKQAEEWGCHGFITDDPLEASRWRASTGSQGA